jgi:hypothetical protein
MALSPLFDLYDPYGILQQQAETGLLPYGDEEEIEPYGMVPVGPRKATLSDLMPQEEQRSMLGRLADMGTSGLAGIGWVLDTPGAMVRGLLSEGPGKALSALWDTSDERVTGRELLRQYGVIGDEDGWGNFAGGLAAEVLLDPTTYFAPWALLGKTGGLSRVGKAMEASGAFRNLAEDAADFGGAMRAGRGLPMADVGTREYTRMLTPRQWFAQIEDPAERAQAMLRFRQQSQRLGVQPGRRLDESAGALWDFRVPRTNIGASVSGGAAGDAAARFLDSAGRAMRYAPGIGQAVRGLDAIFDSRAGGLGTVSNDLELTGDVQLANRRARNTARELESDFLREMFEVEDSIRSLPPSAQLPAGQYGPAMPFPRMEDSRLMQAAADYIESQAVPPGGVGPMLPRSSGNQYYDQLFERVPEYSRLIETFDDIGLRSAADAVALGLPDPTWSSQAANTGWVARQLKRFQRDAPPEIPGGGPRQYNPYGMGERLLATGDNFGRSRRSYTDIPFPQRTARTLSGTAPDEFERLVSTGQAQNAVDSQALQQSLIRSPSDDATALLMERAFAAAGTPQPYQYIIDDVMNSPAFASATPAAQQQMLGAAQGQVRQNYLDYADLLRTADTQFAQTGTGLYDTNAWANMLRYGRGQARVQANAGELIEQLIRRADNTPAANVAGGVNIGLAQAAERLGFDPDNFQQMWQRRVGSDVTNFSVNERFLNALSTLAPQTRLDNVSRGLVRGVDNITNAFKVGALAYPGYTTRNIYGGVVNAIASDAFNPLDFLAAFRGARGNRAALGRRLRNTPGYANLASDEERARRLLQEAAAQKVGQSTVDDIQSGLPEQSAPSLVLGQGPEGAVRRAFYNQDRTWRDFLGDFFGLRGVGVFSNPLPENTNPLLVLNDIVNRTTEDTLRLQTFLNQVRRGIDPGVAGDVTRTVNVDYSPQAYSAIERDFLKRLVPFYSFQKGIVPSITTNLIRRPGGFQNQSIRAVTRGSEPSEDNFTPPYLRQSSAIPLPDEWGSGNPELRRYLTSIDLPWESFFNLLSPGTGSTTLAALGHTLRDTGSNLLGQTNPLLKAPLEYVTNRQLYSGRDLSDTYSVLERDLGDYGRPLEQAVMNVVPFGSRALGVYRTATDDRLTTQDKMAKLAFNLLAGAKIRDIDIERTRQQAARQMLNDMLQTTPGVRTYENITVPEDVLRQMPEEQRQMYLLYRVIQADAAKRARERKKQEAALDPLQVLGVVNQL